MNGWIGQTNKHDKKTPFSSRLNECIAWINDDVFVDDVDDDHHEDGE